jgi:hypothetical protein
LKAIDHQQFPIGVITTHLFCRSKSRRASATQAAGKSNGQHVMPCPQQFAEAILPHFRRYLGSLEHLSAAHCLIDYMDALIRTVGYISFAIHQIRKIQDAQIFLLINPGLVHINCRVSYDPIHNNVPPKMK